MLDRQKVILAFEQKRTQFHDYVMELNQQSELVRELLADFTGRDHSAILDALAQRGITWPGALPTHELDAADGLRIPFHQQWMSHEDARKWAMHILRDRPVAAVDGSQITPTKDFSTPVGAIQIGWYVNYHESGGRYVKDVEFDVIGPDELAAAEDDADLSGGGFANWLVNQARFVGECRRLCKLMIEHAALPESQRPVCFLDGSLILSFAGQMRPGRSKPYVEAVTELLACSEQHRTPLVAYVDTSFSHDLVTLIQLLADRSASVILGDSALLRRSLPVWGDRSPLFYCARQDKLSETGVADFYRDVAFTYAHIVEERNPARVEMPRWQVESGIAESVMDVVRAECVIGAGYPYAVETADATAVISMQDRQRFYALWQQFMQKEGIPFSMARKAGSKLGRR